MIPLPALNIDIITSGLNPKLTASGPNIGIDKPASPDVDGIENVFNKIKGSCSMLILTEDGIIAARDKWGRTPIVIGKKEGAYAATSESSSLPNLDYEIEKYVGPGEIIRLRADGMEQMRKPNEGMQICTFYEWL